MGEFLFINIALLSHNLGQFGFYEWFWWNIQYDNIVHFLSSATAAYIVFDFLARKLNIKKSQKVAKTVIEEHKLIFVMLTICFVAALGALVEMIEFGGFFYLGEGDGILFFGSGDSDTGDITYQYFDTMTDILVNFLGSIAGVLLFYFKEYKQKPWLKY